jgi:hypothetical protein
MNKEYIEAIFSDYLRTERTQYAILINGPWGSGKTYFWKLHLTKIAKDNNLKVIYLSLNGISRIETLEHQLFIALLPYIGNQENKLAKNATTFVTNIINQTSKIFLKTSFSDILKGVSVDAFDFSKYVICFDDLERCQIPVKEVLGFINTYVEHKSAKTIILADESNIDSTQKGYDNIKEKVIGRVLNFELRIEDGLPQLAMRYKESNASFYDFLLRHSSNIIEILKEYKQDNLRIIAFYLDALEKISPALVNTNNEYIQEVLLFSAIVSIEFKKGGLKSSDHKNYNGLKDVVQDYFSLSVTKQMNKDRKQESNDEKTPLEIFYETYLTNRSKNYFFYASIYTYILSGYLKLSELELELKKRLPEELTEEVKDFRTLINYRFRELADNDFKKLTSRVLDFAAKGKYLIYDYVPIANFFYFFSTKKLIPESIEEINRVLLEGLELSKARKELNDRVLANLLHFAEENPEVDKIKKMVSDIHQEIKKEQYLKESNELIECLVKKDEYALAEIFEKHKFSKQMFQYLDNKPFFDTVISITNRQLFKFDRIT